MLDLEVIRKAVHQVAPQYPVKRVFLFGSYANGTASDESDVDFLVQFERDPISIIELCGLRESLAEVLQKDVDVVKYPLRKGSLLHVTSEVSLFEA